VLKLSNTLGGRGGPLLAEAAEESGEEVSLGEAVRGISGVDRNVEALRKEVHEMSFRQEQHGHKINTIDEKLELILKFLSHGPAKPSSAAPEKSRPVTLVATASATADGRVMMRRRKVTKQEALQRSLSRAPVTNLPDGAPLDSAASHSVVRVGGAPRSPPKGYSRLLQQAEGGAEGGAEGCADPLDGDTFASRDRFGCPCIRGLSSGGTASRTASGALATDITPLDSLADEFGGRDDSFTA